MQGLGPFDLIPRDELLDLCQGLSNRSNAELKLAGALMDKGQDDLALPHYRESRRLHRLHKAMWLHLHPDVDADDQSYI